MLRLSLLAVGLFVLIAIVWHVGPLLIIQNIEQLGYLALLVIFLPTVIVYSFEAYGWYLTLGSYAYQVGFARLFMIRMAGEAINNTTPSAYLGGEPVKAYLLKHYGVSLVEGMASVVTAKTIMTLAQILFIFLGIGLAFWVLGENEYYLVAALASVAVLVCGLLLLVLAQRYGIAAGLLKLLRMAHLRIRFLEEREAQLLVLDRTIQSFYTHRRRKFILATGVFFLGWMTETLEVYAILYFLGENVAFLESMSIAALAVLIKGSTFFIPGSMGAQEGGYLLLLIGFGYDEVTGIAFALIRRLREVVWIVLGLIFFATLKWGKSIRVTE